MKTLNASEIDRIAANIRDEEKREWLASILLGTLAGFVAGVCLIVMLRGGWV